MKIKFGVIGDYLAVSVRFFITYRFPKYADYLIRIRKGECKQCGSCCPNYCRFKKNNVCLVYNKRMKIGKKHCVYAPFPLDLKLNPRFRNCGFYY